MTRHSTVNTSAVKEAQATKLDDLLRQALDGNPFYQRKYRAAGLSPNDRPGLAKLETLPYTTKAELVQDQTDHPPFGSNLTHPLVRYTRVHHTSGTTGTTLRWLDTSESWEWWLACWREIYRAAGVTDQDRIFVAFSFGPFIGFWTAFEAGQTLGAMMFPGGGLSSSQRIAALLANEATVLVCTPTYALRLAEVAGTEGVDLGSSSVRLTIHAGEPGASIPSVRALLESAWGAKCFDHVGATEVGAWGHGCSEPGNVHVIETEFIAEVIDRETLHPLSVPKNGAQAGELVLTNLGRVGSPVIRYRTGDLVEFVRGGCACGRETAFLRGGVLGRVDDMLIVRGINVYPSALENVVRAFGEIREFEVVLQTRRKMTEIVIRIETGSEAGERIAPQLVDRIHNQLNLRASVEVVGEGTLPRHDMKARRYVARS